MGQKGKKAAVRRTRRKENGMAMTAGIARTARRDRLTRTLQLLRAALRLWEVRHAHLETPRVWRKQLVRPSQAPVSESNNVPGAGMETCRRDG